MKGIILAGGYGTRLRPLTQIVNKHLLPVYDRPMILYPLTTLAQSGLRDIAVVTERSSAAAFRSFLGSGKNYGVRINYHKQTGAGGIAAALKVTERFAAGGPVAVILGDNVFENNFLPAVRRFRRGAAVFLKRLSSGLERFGVASLRQGKIVKVEEKPKQPASPYAITGFYLFDGSVFDIIRGNEPSDRGELEITDVISEYLRRQQLHHEFVKGYWADVGTFTSLLAASRWSAGQKNI